MRTGVMDPSGIMKKVLSLTSSSKFKKFLLPLFLVLLVLTCVNLYYGTLNILVDLTTDHSPTFQRRTEIQAPCPSPSTPAGPDPCTLNSTRHFIVMTTINYPTESVKKLASLGGWCIVVVGDVKTPSDWEWPNCLYLSLQKQGELGYKILDHLPQNHYGRKNIGYLYAIERGAEVIYETDDDNVLLPCRIPTLQEGQIFFSLFPDSDDLQSAVTPSVCQHVINIYEYFGQPTIWPRGLPLECLGSIVSHTPAPGIISNFTISNRKEYGLVAGGFRIGVDQGLADGDPDLDAIFRLTRVTTNTPIDIHFDPSTPPVAIAQGVITPYNSQNTIYYPDAFWGLLLPISSTSRVSDIWRGFITQRLMWDVGLRLAFRTATVTQIRNPHNYMKDYEQERALYLDGGRLVDFLTNWDSGQSGGDIFSRMISLQAELVKRKFLEATDVALLGAWVEDLQRIGYRGPRIPLPSTSLDRKEKRRLAWILHFSYEPKMDVVELLVQKYGKHFELIVIVSPTGRPSAFGHQLCTNGTEIIWSSKCRNKVDNIPGGGMVRCYVRGLRILSSHPNYNRIQYIVLSNDDVLLNMSKVHELALGGRPVSILPSQHKGNATIPLIFSPPVANTTYFGGWSHWRKWFNCQPLFAQIPEVYKERFRKRVGEKASATPADVFFLPPTSVQEFMELGGIVGDCWLEIALVNILQMLSEPLSSGPESDSILYYWDPKSPWEDEGFAAYVATKSDIVAIHPFKLSYPKNRAAFLKLKDFY